MLQFLHMEVRHYVLQEKQFNANALECVCFSSQCNVKYEAFAFLRQGVERRDSFQFPDRNYSKTITFFLGISLTMYVSHDFRISSYQERMDKIGREESCAFHQYSCSLLLYGLNFVEQLIKLFSEMFSSLSLTSNICVFLGVSLFFFLLSELYSLNVQQTALTILGKQLYTMQVTSLLKVCTVYFVMLDVPSS